MRGSRRFLGAPTSQPRSRSSTAKEPRGSIRAKQDSPWPTLAGLTRAVVACERCPRLRRHCEAVAAHPPARYRGQVYWGRPVPGFGDPKARLLVVGLAPAANGGNRTGRVFTGDSSGDWLYEALHRFGFANQAESVSRHDGLRLTGCYVAAAARCAPPANKPTPAEFASCREYLTAEIALLDRVRVVLALGSLAHEHWLRAAGWWERLPARERPKFGHAAEAALPNGTTLLSSYHPSRQNTNTGKLTRPMWHGAFRRARALVDRTD
jgi:uracil-DNA glycosylase